MIRFTLIALLILAPAFSSAVDPDYLLIRSVGGTEAVARLKEVKTIVTSGSVTLGSMQGHFEQYYRVPDKFYLKIEFELFSIVQAYDGRIAWQTDLTGQTTTLSGLEKRELLKTAYQESFSYLFPDRVPGSYINLGVYHSECENYDKYAFITSGIDTVYSYYENESGKRATIESRVDDLEVITFISDYRTVSGVSMPFRSQANAKQAGLVPSFTVSEIIFDKDIDQSIFSKPIGRNRTFGLPDSINALTIPFDYSQGHIRLLVNVNGRERAWFILDSGASITVFHKPFARKVGLVSTGSLPFKGMSGYEESGIFRIDSLSIGDLTLRYQVCGLLDLSGLDRSGPDGIEFGGLLGYDFLSRFPIMVNYAESKLTVLNPNEFQIPDGGIEIKFDLIMQVPSVRAELDGVKGDFMIDLGNSFGLMLHHRFVTETGLIDGLSMIEKLGESIGGIGGSLSGRTALANRFQIGDIIIDSLRVIMPDSAYGMAGSKELAGNIGNKVLETFTLLFDYAGQRIVFYPEEEPIR